MKTILPFFQKTFASDEFDSQLTLKSQFDWHLILGAVFRRALEKRPAVQAARSLAMLAQSAARQTPARRTAM